MVISSSGWYRVLGNGKECRLKKRIGGNKISGNSGSHKKYKFSDKSQSIGGIFSTLFALGAILACGAAVWISFRQRGEGGLEIGVLGIIAVFLSGYGLYLGVRSFREEEIFFLFSWIGSVGNSIILLGMMMLILLGL